MHCPQAVKAAAFFLLPIFSTAAELSGQNALAYTGKLVSFGARPAGSENARKMQAYIAAELKKFGCQVIEDGFQARTPAGMVAMKNIIARFPGKNGKALAVTGHYDTKRFKEFTFVGANDGGSSGGLLLELARAMQGRPHNSDIYIVWFDGEEAFAEWTATDSLYGSRHLAGKWSADGTINRLQALINIDMIGDKDLRLEDELLSSESLRRMVEQIASQLGYARYFSGRSVAVEDDHAPFLRKGVRAIDLIDFDYGPSNSWWHTSQDTMNKLSAGSLQVTGTIVLEMLKRLDQ